MAKSWLLLKGRFSALPPRCPPTVDIDAVTGISRQWSSLAQIVHCMYISVLCRLEGAAHRRCLVLRDRWRVPPPGARPPPPAGEDQAHEEAAVAVCACQRRPTWGVCGPAPPIPPRPARSPGWRRRRHPLPALPPSVTPQRQGTDPAGDPRAPPPRLPVERGGEEASC